MSGFWKQICPSRSVGLTHAHDTQCTEHMPNQCCHCGWVTSMGARHTDPLPPDDIEARRAATDEGIEPKMVTGKGPMGSPFERGRGPLTEEDKRRLVFFCYWVRPFGGKMTA